MRSIIGKLSRVMEKKQKRKIVLLFFVTVFSTFLEVLGVSLMIPLISAILDTNIMDRSSVIREVCNFFGISSHRGFVLTCISVLIATFVFKNLFLMFSYYLQAKFVYHNRYLTEKRLYQNLLHRKYESFLQVQSGEIFRVLDRDVSQTYALLMALLGLGSEALTAAAIVLVIFLADPFMTSFVAVIMGVTLFVIAKKIRPILTKKGVEWQKHRGLSNKWILQGIHGIKEIKMEEKEDYFVKSFGKSSFQAANAEKWSIALNHIPRLMIEMVAISSMLTLIGLFILRGREVEVLMPTLGAFAMAAVRLLPSANRIVVAINSISYQEPSLNKLVEYLDEIGEKEEVKKGKKEGKKLVLKEKVELKNISYQYPNSDKEILNSANMEIPIGKSVGIVGASGAGKTTVIDILLGLLSLQKGEVLADGKSIYENLSDWHSQIGYIPQTIFMLDGSIRENVAFGIEENEIEEEKIWNALREASLEEFVKNLPNGLDTEIGERGIRLSGGQRQRIGIARAIYQEPDLLVFDEATSALDGETETAIMESINRLHGKKTLVIIAHRLQTIEGCDIVYRVEERKIERER